MDLQEAFDQGFEAVRGYVDRSLASQAKRLAAMERQNADLTEKMVLLTGQVAGLLSAPDALAKEIAAVDKKVADVRDLGKSIEAVHKSIDALPRPDVAGMITEALAKSEGQVLQQTNAMIDKRVALEVATLAPSEKAEDERRAEVASLVKGEAERILAGWERPQDGKSVTVEELAPLVEDRVQRAVSAIPVPKDGRDGLGHAGAVINREGHLIVTLTDGKTCDVGHVVGKDVDMVIVKGMVDEATHKAIAEAMAALPKPKDGEPGQKGDPGSDGAPGLAGKDGLAGADGKDGAPGRDGKDAEPVTKDQIIEAIRSTDAIPVAVQQYLKANPPAAGKDGANGEPGERGEKGDPGDRGPAGDKGEPGQAGAAGRDGIDGAQGAKGEPGDPGRDGEKGEKGDRGDDGQAGINGKDGRNGLDAVKFLRGDKGQLMVTMSNGDVLDLGEIDGKDGTPGKDGEKGLDGINGKDGVDSLVYDDVEEAFEDDGRLLVRRLKLAGEVVKEIRHQTKMPIWRGPFDRGREYQPGDMATWNGSVWHCNTPIKGKIGGEHWALSVKKGRDAPETVRDVPEPTS